MMFARSAPDEAGGHAGDDLQIRLGVERYLARVQLQDLQARRLVGPVDEHVAIEAPGAQQRGIENLGAVGRRHQDHADARVEAVQLDEQLVQRLLALLVRDRADAARLAQGVQLVDEDDARRLLLRLFEQVAHARRADADEHLDEVGAADREERHPGLAGDGTRQQRLAGAGRSHQHARPWGAWRPAGRSAPAS